jgi:hypothetical protein
MYQIKAYVGWMDSKKRRYQEELKRIRQLSAINKVLKKGDVENAFLNNADKDTEISKDTAVERMLEELQADKGERKDLAILDSLVTEEAGSTGSASRRRSAPRVQRRSMPRRRPVAKKARRAAPKQRRAKRKR